MKNLHKIALLLGWLALAGLAQAIAQEKPGEQKGQAKSQAQRPLREQSRIWIIRGLLAERATLRKPLPLGDRGLPLGSDGNVDEQELQRRTTGSGTAVRPGEVVQITKIDFRKSSMVFQINGGPRKRKWYQGVQVGMGGGPVVTRSDPNQPAPVIGSSIELNFPGQVPDLTVDEVKQMLAPVLDFARRSPTVIYTETLPKEIQEAIKDHKVTVGMDRDMVLAAKGRPDRKERQRKGRVETEDWIYGTAPARITIITFQGDKVVKVGEYQPGVAETEAGRAQPLPPERPAPPTKPQ